MHRYMDVTYKGNAGAVTEELLPRVESGTETESNAWSGCRVTEGTEKT